MAYQPMITYIFLHNGIYRAGLTRGGDEVSVTWRLGDKPEAGTLDGRDVRLTDDERLALAEGEGRIWTKEEDKA